MQCSDGRVDFATFTASSACRRPGHTRRRRLLAALFELAGRAGALALDDFFQISDRDDKFSPKPKGRGVFAAPDEPAPACCRHPARKEQTIGLGDGEGKARQRRNGWVKRRHSASLHCGLTLGSIR
jgi:hypothetical protein